MGVRDVLPLFTDDRSNRATVRQRHVECRDCGRNLHSNTEECPDCGGGIAVYDLS